MTTLMAVAVADDLMMLLVVLVVPVLMAMMALALMINMAKIFSMFMQKPQCEPSCDDDGDDDKHDDDDAADDNDACVCAGRCKSGEDSCYVAEGHVNDDVRIAGHDGDDEGGGGDHDRTSLTMMF